MLKSNGDNEKRYSTRSKKPVKLVNATPMTHNEREKASNMKSCRQQGQISGICLFRLCLAWLDPWKGVADSDRCLVHRKHKKACIFLLGQLDDVQMAYAYLPHRST